MDNLAPVSRNNVKNEPSSRQPILWYLESLIPIPCGASILWYRCHLTWLYSVLRDVSDVIVSFCLLSSETAQMYVKVFTDIGRLPQLYKYHSKCHKVWDPPGRTSVIVPSSPEDQRPPPPPCSSPPKTVQNRAQYLAAVITSDASCWVLQMRNG